LQEKWDESCFSFFIRAQEKRKRGEVLKELATPKISGIQRYESNSMGNIAYFNASLCPKIGMSVSVKEYC
jgi:ribosomal protein L14E/L6E/L27E